MNVKNNKIVVLKVTETLRQIGIHKSKKCLIISDPYNNTNLADYCNQQINDLYNIYIISQENIKLGQLIYTSQVLYFFNNKKIPNNFENYRKRSDWIWGIIDYRTKEIIIDNENAINSFYLFLKEIENKPINLKFNF